MTHVDAFLADIREHPDDDTPRLIFADWLDDAGHEGRAAFIRAQCADPRQSCGLRVRREGAEVLVAGVGCVAPPWLFTAPDTRTLPARPDGVTYYRFRRGFLDGVGFHPVAWLADGRKVAPLAPAALIRLWDLEPWHAAGRAQWCWVRGDAPLAETPVERANVPPDLFDHLTGQRERREGLNWAWYTSKPEAMADLSAAALAWALQPSPLTARSIWA
jgi:uncharacterized protein (TIGR02996 family)